MAETAKWSSARRLGLEALVITASILAAFALDRWWDSREAEREHQQVLAGLEAEFQAARTELEYYRDLQQRIERAVNSIAAQLHAAAATGAREAAVPDTALGLLYVAPTVRPSLGTLSGLLSSARLGVVRDPELRNALASWAGVYDELAEEEEEGRRYVMNQLDPVMRTHLDVSAFRTIALRQADGSTSREELARTSRVPAVDELRGAIAGRAFYLHHGIDEYGPVLAHVELILRLIDGSTRR
jgi:hypothetical protein